MNQQLTDISLQESENPSELACHLPELEPFLTAE